jgi:hypothetical protein
MNHDDGSAAEPEPPRKYDLFYDDVHIGQVVETMPDFPSSHGTVAIEVTGGRVEWHERIDRYVDLSREHHRLTLAGDQGLASALEPDIGEAIGLFGDHLWYLVNREARQHLKIRRPYFGTDAYVRYSYAPTKIDYDPLKLTTWFRTRLILMIGSLTPGEAPERDALDRHLGALTRLATVCDRAHKDDADLNRLVAEWFGTLSELDSSLPMFNDPAARRRLDQMCARM